MTYEQYLADCQAQQRAYIVEQQERMAQAEKAWQAYATAMRAIDLHPLDRRELTDRNNQLAQMARTVEQTHGDSPAARAAYAIRR